MKARRSPSEFMLSVMKSAGEQSKPRGHSWAKRWWPLIDKIPRIRMQPTVWGHGRSLVLRKETMIAVANGQKVAVISVSGTVTYDLNGTPAEQYRAQRMLSGPERE